MRLNEEPTATAAVLAIQSGDVDRGVHMMVRAAEAGDEDAQRNLGTMYREGIGVEKDQSKAFFWYGKADRQGYATGQANLGAANTLGVGVSGWSGVYLHEDASAPLRATNAGITRNGVQDVKPNAYGLGVNMDAYGRPHVYRGSDGRALPGIFAPNVKRDAYGLGVHMDQFGRPVYDSSP